MKIIDFFIAFALIGFLFVAYSGFLWTGILGFFAVGILAGLRFFDERAAHQNTGAAGDPPYDPPFGDAGESDPDSEP